MGGWEGVGRWEGDGLDEWEGVGVGGEGRWGAEGGIKHPFGLKEQCCAFSK